MLRARSSLPAAIRLIQARRPVPGRRHAHVHIGDAAIFYLIEKTGACFRFVDFGKGEVFAAEQTGKLVSI